MTSSRPDSLTQYVPSRRELLWNLGGGFGGIALASLLGTENLLASERLSPPHTVLHHPARAKRVVQLYMSGAASQCDLWDYKPELVKSHGEKFDPGEAIELFQSSPDKVMQSPFAWQRYGQSGKWLSDPVAPLGAYWSRAYASSKSGAARTTGSPGAIGIRTRI